MEVEYWDWGPGEQGESEAPSRNAKMFFLPEGRWADVFYLASGPINVGLSTSSLQRSHSAGPALKVGGVYSVEKFIPRLQSL